MDVRAGTAGRLAGVALLSLLWGAAGCTSGSAEPSPASAPASAPIASATADSAAEDAVAVIGGKTITRAELTERLMDGYGAETLRDMMARQAVRLEAGQLGVKVADDELEQELRKMSEGYGNEQAFYEAMRQQLGMNRDEVREDAEYRLLLEKLATRDVRIPEKDIRRYYEEHRQEYGAKRQFHLAWIVTDTKEQADKALGQLEAGTDFGVLAARYSTDGTTSGSGGDLGWVDEGDPFQDPKLLSAAGQLNVGEAAGPLQSDQGYVILELKGLKTVEGRSYEEVRGEIEKQLALEQAKPMHDLEQSLLSKYGARVLDPRLAGSSDLK